MPELDSAPAASPTGYADAVRIGALCATLIAVVYIFRETFASLISVWFQSGTFNHCVLIGPISLFLIWQRREELGRVEKRVSVLGFAAVFVLSLMWYVARSVNIQVGEHLAVVLLFPAAALAFLGTEASKTLAFPLAFLLFAVPFGEGLIPILMNFTADFTVHALRVTGIPVAREGFYFSIPSGDFEIAKACSGIRYLIACSSMGVLFAFLTYVSYLKRALFILVSIIAPIIANGIRAYMIVMIADLSGMRLAVGVDHLIYGWLLFAVLIGVLFWGGSYFRDLPFETADGLAVAGAPPTSAAAADPSVPRGHSGGSARGLAAALLLIVSLAAAGPLAYQNAREGTPAEGEVRLPLLGSGWVGPSSVTDGSLTADRSAKPAAAVGPPGRAVDVSARAAGGAKCGGHHPERRISAPRAGGRVADSVLSPPAARR